MGDSSGIARLLLAVGAALLAISGAMEERPVGDKTLPETESYR
jgi:hypothetical protein